jgi:predicted transcriptional regulator
MRPGSLRRLKAKMALKGLTLREVASRANVPYSTASNVLNGAWIHREYLRRLEKAIREAPMPEEATA